MFVGTLRDNLVMALDDAAGGSTQAVGRRTWTASCTRRSTRSTRWRGPRSCRTGWTPGSGQGGHALTPAQAQQLALARLVLADPHTLVLDEATSLIDPRAARHLERSLAAVLEGRTVVAIAHRLFSAHDADRVAVIEDGVVAEIGTARRAGRLRRLVRRALAVLARRADRTDRRRDVPPTTASVRRAR